MYQRIQIVLGLLVCDEADYPLTAEDADTATTPADYRGDAWVESGRLVIGRPDRDTVMHCYKIGTATPESIDRAAGTALGKEQKRCFWPNGKSDMFVDSWIAAWEERRPGATRGFIPDFDQGGKMVRESYLKRKQFLG